MRFGHINLPKFEISLPYIQDEMTWCVSQAKPVAQWKSIFYIAENDVYIVAFFELVIGLYVVFLLYTFEKKPRDIFYCLLLIQQTLIAFPAQFRARNCMFRFFYGLILLTSFWFTQIFCAYYVVFTSHTTFEKQIATLNEISISEFHLAGDRLTTDQFWVKDVVNIHNFRYDLHAQIIHEIFLAQFSQEQIKDFEVCHDIDECLQRLKFDDNLAVAASRLHVQTQPFQEDIFCFDKSQNVYDYSAVFLIQRNFPLKSEFIRLFDKIRYSGLIIKWQEDFVEYRRKARESFSEDNISIKALVPTFLYIATPIISFVFALELLIYQKSHSNNVNQLWINMDKFISGKRYYLLLKSNQNTPKESSSRNK